MLITPQSSRPLETIPAAASVETIQLNALTVEGAYGSMES